GYGAIAAREGWLRQNRAEVLNFFKAYLEALAMLRQDAGFGQRVIGKFSRLNDREVLQESYRTSVPHMPTRPYVNREIIVRALKKPSDRTQQHRKYSCPFIFVVLKFGKMVPKKVFFTKGVGVHKEKLASFEMALRVAGLAHCNLVLVSSIYPPGCKIIPKEEG